MAKAGKQHEVEIEVVARGSQVVLEVLRRNRGDSKSDLAVVLSSGRARELQRLLQGRADEAARQAYLKTKAATSEQTLDQAVESVAAAVGLGPLRG